MVQVTESVTVLPPEIRATPVPHTGTARLGARVIAAASSDEKLARARELIDALDLDATHGIVLAEEGWHPGVIGIVASRLVEEFGRPTVLVALEGDVGKGSGRSISGVDLGKAGRGLYEAADCCATGSRGQRICDLVGNL